MQPSDIISSIVQNQIDPSWVIFKYHNTRALWMGGIKLLYVILLVSFTFILWRGYQNKPETYTLVMAAILGGAGIGAILVFLWHVYTMFFFQTNLIVLTNTEVIKSARGQIVSYPYEHIQNLEVVRIQGHSRPYTQFPEHYLRFTDARTRKIIELAWNREFGRADDIYTVLKTRVK